MDPQATPAEDQPSADAAPAAVAEPATPAVNDSGPDLSWIGDDFRTDGQPDLARFREHYEGLLAEDARRREAPAAPEDGQYDLSIPADLDLGDYKLPEDVKIQLLTDDPHFAPVFDELRSFLHANGLPQQTATGLMGLLAKYQAAQHVADMRAAQAEYEKLAATPQARDARVNSVKRSLESRLPSDQAQALMAATRTSAGIRAIEALLQRSSGPLAAPASPQRPSFEGLRGSALLAAVNAAQDPSFRR